CAALADQDQEPGLAVLEGGQRFLHGHWLSAAPADPARHGAVLTNQRLRPRLGRCGAFAADHGSNGEGPPAPREGAGPGKPAGPTRYVHSLSQRTWRDLSAPSWPPPDARDSAGYSVTP